MARARKPAPDGLVAPPDAMAELGIGRSSLRNLILAGELDRVDVNSSPDRARPVWRITRASIDRFKESRLDA
jgi:hypothetical protein